jgi:hypothetical protein
MKIVTLLLFIISTHLCAEETAWIRNKNTKWSAQIKKSYQEYWTSIKSKNYENIHMSKDYYMQALIDHKKLKQASKADEIQFLPVFFKKLKKRGHFNTYAIAADMTSKTGATIKEETGCYIVQIEESRIRYMSYLGDCLSYHD